MIPQRLQTIARALGLAAIVLAAADMPTLARDRDHDEARHAVETGEVRKLSEILDIVRDKLPGQIIGVRIEHQREAWTYEFKVINASGKLLDVYVDARTGDIRRIKEK